MTHAQGDFIADAFNPALTLFFLAYGIWKLPTGLQRSAFFSRSGVALLITWGLTHLDRWWPVLRDLVGFPSGHMAWAVSVATSFAILEGRSLLVTIPSAFLYGVLVIFLDFHSGWDLLSASLLALAVTLVCHHRFGPKLPETRRDGSRSP